MFKFIRWSVSLSIAFCLFGLLTDAVQGECRSTGRHALLIGISRYDVFNKDGMFPNLLCDRDVAEMALVLKSRFGFKDSDITELTSSRNPNQTTRAAILAALRRLINETHAGDIVFIDYSGHGSKVDDPTKPDGLESTIVPADYRTDPSSETSSNEISGRTIARILTLLRKRHPAQIVLSFDCCHSGDISRGEFTTRGMGYDGCSNWYQQKYGHLPAKPQPNPTVLRHDDNGALDDLENGGYVVFSACATDECACETEDSDPPMGRFTKALVHALAAASSTTTYRQVFDEITADFEANYPDQHPQFAGNLDTYLLGGVAPAPSHAILVHLSPANCCILDAGALQDVTSGSTFTLYRKNAVVMNGSTTIGEGVVTGVGPIDSALTITALSGGRDELSSALAVEKTHNYRLSRLKFDAGSVASVLPDRAPEVLAQLSDLSLVTFDYPPKVAPDVKLERTGSGVWLARGDTGYAFKKVDPSGDLPHQLVTDLDRESRYRYVLRLIPPTDSQTTSVVGVQVRVVSAKQVDDGSGTMKWVADDDGHYSPHRVGDDFVIEARNVGSVPEHVTIIDLDSDGAIAVRWPEEGVREEDNVVTPNDSWVPLWVGDDIRTPLVYQFNGTDPGEIFKAIATDTYVDLNSLARGERGETSPFDFLFGPGFTGSRGSDTLLVPSQWATAQTRITVWPSPMATKHKHTTVAER